MIASYKKHVLSLLANIAKAHKIQTQLRIAFAKIKKHQFIAAADVIFSK